jgi:hypothetical protein
MIELLGNAIPEVGCPQRRNAESTGSHHKRSCMESMAHAIMFNVNSKLIAPCERDHTASVEDLDVAASALARQHVDDLLSGPVAEELSQGLLVPGDPVRIDHIDEILRTIPRECRAGKVGIVTQEIGMPDFPIGKVAPATSRDPNLLPWPVIMLDN